MLPSTFTSLVPDRNWNFQLTEQALLAELWVQVERDIHGVGLNITKPASLELFRQAETLVHFLHQLTPSQLMAWLYRMDFPESRNEPQATVYESKESLAWLILRREAWKVCLRLSYV